MQAQVTPDRQAGGNAPGNGNAGMLSAKPTSVSAAHPLRTHPRAAVSRQRRAHLPLIVHADDFGETAEITEGICLAIEAGVVTSTSVMVNMPGTAQALRRAPQLGQQASFGIHLNLCEGRPLTQGATLMGPDGQFLRKRPLAVRALTGKLSLVELEREVTAQVGMLRDAGVRISHLDGHKHLHQLPIVCAAVANVLPRFGIERVRITRLASWRRVRGPSMLAREIAARHAARVFARARLRSPLRIIDLRELLAGNDLAPLAGRRGVEPAPVEICCHPGTPAADAGKPGSHQRGDELEYLLSPQFRAVLAASGAALVSYWRV